MKKILVVDDEELIRSLLSLALEEDYSVACCQSGFEACEWLQENDADLIITDLMMPMMDGIELIHKIRSESTTPIIAISGGNGGRISHRESRLNLALKAGADEAVEKPFELTDLLKIVERLLETEKNPAALFTKSGSYSTN